MVTDYFDILLIISRLLEIVPFNVKKCSLDTRLLNLWNSRPYLRVLLLTCYPFSPIPELHQAIFKTGVPVHVEMSIIIFFRSIELGEPHCVDKALVEEASSDSLGFDLRPLIRLYPDAFTHLR